MSLTALPPGLEWFAAVAEMTAGVCLAIPALRLSHHLLQLDRIRAGATQNADALERLRDTYVSAMSRLLAKWDRRGHWLLRIGFATFVLAAAANIARLWLAVQRGSLL